MPFSVFLLPDSSFYSPATIANDLTHHSSGSYGYPSRLLSGFGPKILVTSDVSRTGSYGHPVRLLSGFGYYQVLALTS